MTTRKAGPASGAGYRLEAQVGHLLRRAHQRASATFAKHIGDPQITPTQFAALVARLVPGGKAVSAAILAPLSADERVEFLTLLKRLGQT